MNVTERNKDLNALTPQMKKQFTLWLNDVRKAFPKLNIRIGETKRSLDRQKYLFASGRTRKGKILTYTLDSRHIIGEAVDIFLTNKLTPFIAIWNVKVYKEIYLKVPPRNYGLEILDFEMVHLQLKH